MKRVKRIRGSMKDGRQNKNAPSESRPNAIPRTTMLYPVAKDCDDTHIVEIESLFEGDGAAKLDAEERTSMGAYVNGIGSYFWKRGAPVHPT